MKNKLKIIALLSFALFIVITGLPQAKAVTPPVSILKVGLYHGGAALQAANLQNVSGMGSGYDFGYFDSSRNFVPIGAYTDATKISMLKDRNMYYISSTNVYEAGTDGNVVVGCYHIMLQQAFSSFGEALSAVSGYNSGFVKYDSGSFYACIGNYTSDSEAYSVISSLGLSNATITSGTSRTIAVVETGTNRMLFEFDGGGSQNLGVMPRSTGVKCQTWFKGLKYYGGFQYTRLDGNDLTVVNIVGVEDYTKGVLPYEVGNTWPIEALKAQALCAKSYAMTSIGSHTSGGFDLCVTEHCQVYKGTNSANELTDRAVDETAGMYITYNGEICKAFFSSCDGGATDNVENVWPNTIPYLRGVIDPYEADVASSISGYYWQLSYTPAELTQRLQSRGYSCSTIVSMQITQYTELGNVMRVTVTDSNGRTLHFTKGDAIRSALGAKSIRFKIGNSTDAFVNNGSNMLEGGPSSAYAIGGDGLISSLPGGNVYAITGTGEIEVFGEGGSSNGMINGKFVINGTGHGHNVGMSQYGAYSMAKYHNKTFYDIITFYFTGVTIG